MISKTNTLTATSSPKASENKNVIPVNKPTSGYVYQPKYKK